MVLCRLCKALTLAIQFSSMPPQTKIDLYIDLNKYASEVVITQIKTEARLIALENEVKLIKTKVNNYYKQ